MLYLTLIHVLTCFTLVLVVLVQSSKGEGLSSILGGGPSTLFGTQTGTFLTKLTAGLAMVFLISSLVLAGKSPSQPESVVGEEEEKIWEVEEGTGPGEVGKIPGGAGEALPLGEGELLTPAGGEETPGEEGPAGPLGEEKTPEENSREGDGAGSEGGW